MKHICLMIFFLLICCTINSVTATEVNNTINHTVFVNDISDIINEIDYNNPINQNGEYIQQHINYIKILNDDFKLFRSLNVKNNNSSFINPIYKSLNKTSNNNYTNNLVNKTDFNNSGKYNYSNVLFNDSSNNQSQYNKSFKVFELDKDSSVKDNSIGLTNDSISKELNNSEINNISNNNFSRDNHINHVSEPKQDKDYIMLLIPILLVLGAIILYKLKK